MNAKFALALATLAVAASGVARADEADASQFAVQVESSRTRAEVMAEANAVAKTRSTEPAGSRVAAPVRSSVDTKSLREQTARALRAGQISFGEI